MSMASGYGSGTPTLAQGNAGGAPAGANKGGLGGAPVNYTPVNSLAGTGYNAAPATSVNASAAPATGAAPATTAAPVAGGFNANQAAADALQLGMAGTIAAGTYSPMNASQGMDAYYNPYEQNVVNSTMRDLMKGQRMSLNDMDFAASAAGAFGGSRHGIEGAETRGLYADKAYDAVSKLRQDGFNTALGAAQFDVDQQTAANTNMLSAADQLAAMGQQSFDAGQTIEANQMRYGIIDQGLQQALIDAAKGQFGGYTSAPGTSTQFVNNALGSTPAPESQTQTDTYQPGMFDYLKLAASLVPT